MHVRQLPDLAVRTLGGAVVWANDESFAERENLILPQAAVFDPALFGHKGKVYDGWETRRRREPGHDAAVVRLGIPGVVRGVVVDTAWFRGNYPAQVSIEAVCVEGHPSVDDLLEAGWQTLVPATDLQGDTENVFEVTSERRWTHVRLSIHPDGGVARLRVHGEPLPDPDVLDALAALDLAALENGGRIVGCSNMFYGAPANLISPGVARSMSEGWETARRRDDGNDWVTVRLAESGAVRVAEVDTSYFLFNAPGQVALHGCHRPGVDDPGPVTGDWTTVLPRTPLQPDTRHRFVLEQAIAAEPLTHVRMDVYPDGGVARLRLVGSLTPEGRASLRRRRSAAQP